VKLNIGRFEIENQLERRRVLQFSDEKSTHLLNQNYDVNNQERKAFFSKF
jgi:hypothetical protein